MGWLHPVLNRQELDRYRDLGEAAYVAERRREALDFIAAHPSLFLANTARRAYWFWCGTTKGEADDPWQLLRRLAYTEVTLLSLAGLWLMARRKRPEALLFAGLLTLYPLVYYVTFVVPRYRQPIDPEMFLLVAYAVAAVPACRPPWLVRVADAGRRAFAHSRRWTWRRRCRRWESNPHEG
jgi:hypothetical protein